MTKSTEGLEVDLVLEAANGAVVGVEVKSSNNPKSDDFNGLRQLAKWTGESFAGGVVFHTGTEVIPFGEKLWALPVAWLWEKV